MQQVLIHVIPIFFALYMYVSLFHKTRLHWAIRGVLLFLILISCQYPAFCRSFFVGYLSLIQNSEPTRRPSIA